MSPLFRLIFATACKSTHHKLALDALRHIRGTDATRWRDLFLKHYPSYLKGAKAPDDQFKDFKNHVLHVGDGFWGGAGDAARDWYGRLVAALGERSWDEAAFAAGVVGHYYSDPLMPFHTGQTEEEGKVHRAAEWSITKSYDELQIIIEKDFGYPAIETPDGPDWLTAMVRAGAVAAHPHYSVLIDHYDLAKGVKNPPAGLDQECKDRIAQCLAHATIGISRILERALAESGALPPAVSLSLETVLAGLAVPIRFVTAKIADAKERALVERIYAEVRQTGKAIQSLPEDDKLIRRQHAQEVLKISSTQLDAQPARPTGQHHGDGAEPRLRVGRPNSKPVVSRTASPVSRPRHVPTFGEPAAIAIAPEPPALRIALEPEKPAKKPRVRKPKPAENETGPRFYLEPASPIKDAPSIGAATARRFEELGFRTVADLLALDAETAAVQLGIRRFDATALREIQIQARLACRIPGLRGHDAQILTACGLTDPAALAGMTPEELFARIAPFLATPAALRILRTSPPPDLKEAGDWIAWAREARPLAA